MKLIDILKEWEEVNGQRIEYFRAVGEDEMKKAVQLKHLPYPSKDPISTDWEVIELSMQQNSVEGQDPDEYVNSLVSWRPVNKGVNLTTDFENAKGYGDYVLGLDIVSPSVDFTNSHVFAKDPNKVIVVAVYDVKKGKWTSIK